MKDYDVMVTKTISKCICVEANSKEEAEKNALVTAKEVEFEEEDDVNYKVDWVEEW